MRGLIVSSGTITDFSRLELEIRESDFVVCADGGVSHLIKVNKKPDIVIGDLDSINQSALKYIEDNNILIEKYPSIKDVTDTDIAVDYLIENGYKEIVLMGVTGTRQDHTMANILLLNTLHDRGVIGKIVDDNNNIYLIDDYLELKYQENSYISVLPLVNEGIIISLEGFFYNLDHQFIPFASTHGVSNKIVGDLGIIKIHRGRALVFVSKD